MAGRHSRLAATGWIGQSGEVRLEFEKGRRELWEEIWMFQTVEGGSGS